MFRMMSSAMHPAISALFVRLVEPASHSMMSALTVVMMVGLSQAANHRVIQSLTSLMIARLMH